MCTLEELSYPAVTVEQMRKIDQTTIEQYGISAETLMENAGSAVLESIKTLPFPVQTVAVFVGKGNNGGDGLVVARKLIEAGKKVLLLLSCDKQKLTGLRQFMWNKMADMKKEVHFLNTEGKIREFEKGISSVDLIVDALFGIGLKGEVRAEEKSLIELIYKMNSYVISIDCPSGLNCDTGKPMGIAVTAEKTITFGVPKTGFFRYPAPDYIGELEVADIGFPLDVINTQKDCHYYLNCHKMGKLLPPRKKIFHKGDAGKVAIIGGALSMSGAIVLAARAAYRSGAGLVYLLVPDKIATIIAAKVTEPLVYGLKSTPDGTISQLGVENILSLVEKCDVVLLGPGMGRNRELVELLKKILTQANIQSPDKSKIPYICDADAIHNIKDTHMNLNEITMEIGFTPHTGELAYFLGKSVQYLNANRFEACMDFSRNTQKLLILKGTSTLICQGEKIFINPTGNPGMATGGSGDVLAGIFASFLAQGLDMLEAACLSAFVHGYAGDLAARKKSVYSLTARDIIDSLPQTFLQLEKMK